MRMPLLLMLPLTPCRFVSTRVSDTHFLAPFSPSLSLFISRSAVHACSLQIRRRTGEPALRGRRRKLWQIFPDFMEQELFQSVAANLLPLISLGGSRD